ncbi:MAG TPA: TonB-dependent receptor, partial [Acidobacteriaceae bacterium]
AKLTLTQQETGFNYNSVSNDTGGFSFPGLNIGTYTLKATAKGFQAYSVSGLVLNVSQTLGADVKLSVGAETVEVSVTADALQVQADSNTVSTLISGEQVTEIATENRNFTALAALGMGVSSNLPDNNTPTSVASSASISVNGLRQSHNIWLIDGGEADDRGGAGGMDVMPSMDAIAQFEVLASNYPPDYGISSGATMSLALKSGTQKFHGEAYDFVRNDIFDANYFFNKHKRSCDPNCEANYSPVSKLRQNIFGGNLGGPIPFGPMKNKTFFFYNQEWRRIVQGSAPNVQPTIPEADRPVAGTDLVYIPPAYAPNQILYVPGPKGGVTDQAYLKKLQALNLTPDTPFGLDPAGSHHQIIPHELFDTNGFLYLNGPLLPHVAQSSSDNSVSSITNPITVTEEIVRIDHKVNDKWQILGHYIHDAVTQGYPDADLGWNWESYNTISSTLSNPANSAAVKISGTITPSLLLEASFNYDGNIINITNGPTALNSNSEGWVQNTFFSNSGSNQYPGGSWGGKNISTGEQTGYGPWHNAAQDYEPKVDLSYTRGKHSFKFGFSYNRYTKNQQLQANAAGDYSFGQNQTGAGGNPDNSGTWGDPFMSQLLGLAGGYNQPQTMVIRHYVNQTPSVYANDNWKVTPRLSMQIGFRYDALPHAWERANALANFDPAAYVPVPPMWNPDGSIDPTSVGVIQPKGFTGLYYMNGMYVPGQSGYPHGVVENDFNTWQPRVGFSYDLTGKGKTVLRMGFGTFYERLQGNDIYGVANSNLPYEYTPSVTNVYYSKQMTDITGAPVGQGPYCSWASTGNTTDSGACLNSANLPILPANLTTLARTYKAPGVAQYSLGIQHELKPSMILIVQYVGNDAWHQNIDKPINNFPLTTSDANRLAFSKGGFATNQYRTYQGYGSITQVENTTGTTYNGGQAGLRIQNKWGLSGEIDYTYSHNIDLTDTDLQTISNPWNLKYDKASSGYDRRHILQANYIYNLPIFRKSTGLMHTLLGGWQLAGTFVDQSGEPVASGFGGANDTIGLGGNYTNRADVVGKIKYHHRADNWFSNPKTDGGADPQAVPVPGYQTYDDHGNPLPKGPNLGFGNGRRDTFVGPGRVNFTTDLYKSFALTERAHFEFRAETYNTFNHTEFSTFGATTGGGNYGVATGTYDPRVMELAGKFVF